MSSSLAAVLERVNLEDFSADVAIGPNADDELLDTMPTKQPLPFRFFDLPSEIRLRIYSFALFIPQRKGRLTNGGVGASSKNMPLPPLSRRISLYLVSRQMHNEASHLVYSSQTFRLFPIQDFSLAPTVREIPPRYRSSVSAIELILGSSWTAPPRSWRVTKGLGLQDMTRVRTLKVFIQCDPSHPMFEGFRISKEFYTEFAGELLRKIFSRLPSLVQVEFDGYPSVQRDGPLMSRLLTEARDARKMILWGPERGWSGYGALVNGRNSID